MSSWAACIQPSSISHSSPGSLSFVSDSCIMFIRPTLSIIIPDVWFHVYKQRGKPKGDIFSRCAPWGSSSNGTITNVGLSGEEAAVDWFRFSSRKARFWWFIVYFGEALTGRVKIICVFVYRQSPRSRFRRLEPRTVSPSIYRGGIGSRGCRIGDQGGS